MENIDERLSKLEAVQEWVMSFALPHKHGNVDPAWLAPRRLHDDNLQSMAGTMLTLLPHAQRD